MTLAARVAHELLRSRAPFALPVLAQRVEASQAQVAAALTSLEHAGCALERDIHGGVRLISTTLQVWPDYLRWRFGPDRSIEVYQRTGSTQDAARRLVQARGAHAHNALVVAHEQTAGRGRLGRIWTAPPGRCLTMSTVLVTSGVAPAVDRLCFASSVAVARAAEACACPPRTEMRIKWPNDVVVDGRKLAGILVESVALHGTPAGGGWAHVLGVGLNIDVDPAELPPELRPRVASLASLGAATDRLRVLEEVLAQIDRALEEPIADLLAEWRRRCVLVDQGVTLAHQGQVIRGRVVDLDPELGLIVRREEGELIHLPAATTSVIESH